MRFSDEQGEWLTTPQVATVLGCTRYQIVLLCERGVIPARQASRAQSRRWLIRRETVEQIRQHKRHTAWAMPGYVTATEAAAALGCSRQRVHQLIRGGELPATRIRNIWCIPADAIKGRKR